MARYPTPAYDRIVRRRKFAKALAVTAYVAAGFFTFGHVYNREANAAPERAVIAGAFWPVYWAGRAAIEWTRP